MERLKFQYLVAFGLLSLLIILAFFQYKWVGQISEAEEERLQKRLELDAKHFADDFNRIVQNAYFTFQINGQNWQQSFLEQYQIWELKSPYPELIKSFQIILPNHEIYNFDSQKKQFIQTGSFSDFNQLQSYFEPLNENNLTLLMPIYEENNRLPLLQQTPLTQPVLQTPNILAFLEIKLDENVIKNQILTELSKKYFPDGDFQLAISSRKTNDQLFETERVEKSDTSIGIFELMPENLAFFVNRNLMTTLSRSNSNGQFIFNQRIEKTKNNDLSTTSKSSMKIEIFGTTPQGIFQGANFKENGRWVLNIQHKSGSLEQFVGNTRRSNLLISFGILGLLGVSIGLIFLSANRAQILAQRQIDFVTAVSHEFRTPISVIFSAGENLADGVASEGQQIIRYGKLIKSEGKKLSAMVEQILEFAGANSKRKKYDFRETNVVELVENSLKDCQPLIDEKTFEVETHFEKNLPFIQADANSLSHAVQNLIINGIKYNNDNKKLKISVETAKGAIKIKVQDYGIGIAKKDLKQIFTPFFRAKEVVDAQIHGNGLGLSLVKQTIDAHHGKIEVESEIRKGSSFILFLPITVENKV